MATYDTTTIIDREAVDRPLFPLLLQFPIVCYWLTLVTDLAYSGTTFLMWQNFSSWLLFAGNVMAGIAAVVALVEYAVGRARNHIGWPLVATSLVVFALGVLNSLVHAGDGWTAVMPWGLTLSIATVVAMLSLVVARRLQHRSIGDRSSSIRRSEP